jgi:hypothetical protein
MSYQESTQCKLLATHCVCCGAPLVDAVSVEMGIGPDCRKGAFPPDISDVDREVANGLVYSAAISADKGKIEEVLETASKLRDLGWPELSDKVAKRFVEGVRRAERDPDITIEVVNGVFVVKTPFRRGAKEAFIRAWRGIPGRRFDRGRGANMIPTAQKEALWGLLIEFFPGKWGKGPKGIFRVPRPVAKPDPQPELGLGS